MCNIFVDAAEQKSNLFYSYGNLSDICSSDIIIKDGFTMKQKHNSSNCGECFGAAMANMQTLLFTSAGFTADMGSLWFVLSSGLNMGYSYKH
jgi:hypothetical protein